MIGDHYSQKWPEQYPWIIQSSPDPSAQSFLATKFEFDQLKREVEDLKALLAKAKKYDEEHGEPTCEMEEKVKLLKRVAELVGVELKL